MSLLFFAGGECLTRHGVLVRRTSIEENVVETHTRTGTVGWFVDSSGVLRNSDAAVPRVDHVGGVPYLLLEEARTNDISQAMASWTWTNSATWTNNTVGPDGGAATGLGVSHASGGGVSMRATDTPAGTETANTVQSFKVYAKAGDVNWCTIRLNRLDATLVQVYYDLANGVLGTVDAGASGFINLVGNGWYECVATADILTGGSSFALTIGPADADGDDTMAAAGAPYCYFYGAQVETDAPYVSSSIPTAGATRNADTFYADFPHPPRELTTYVKVANYRAGQLNARLFHIGGTSDTTDPRLQLAVRSGADIVAIYDDGTTTAQTGAIAAPADGVTMEFLVTLSAAGVVDLAASTDAAAQVDVASAAGGALPAAWAAARLYINSGVATRVGVNRYASVKVAAGTKTMAEMRAL